MQNRTDIHQNLQAVEVVELVKTRFTGYKWPLPLITRVYDSKPAMAALGGFQLLDLIITELKSHMTC